MDPPRRVVGLDGVMQAVRLHRFRQLRTGSASVLGGTIAIGPLHVMTAEMMLGTDWLRRNRVWISYTAHRVTIQPAGDR
jgi:hypothetical protein